MKRTMTKRYYLGSKHISETDGRSEALTTLSEALDRAKESVENGESEIRYVVEVVKIVRRASRPVIVEDVR